MIHLIAAWLSTLMPGAAVAETTSMTATAEPSDAHARVRIICETDSLKPGQTAWVGVVFDIDDRWHLYWDGYNDAGLPPKITWRLPEGFKAGEVLWPAPKRKLDGGELLSHIYEKSVTLLVPIEIPADAKPGSPVALAADLQWMVCDDICLVETGEASVSIPVSASDTACRSKDAALIEASRARIPVAYTPGTTSPLDIAWKDSRWVAKAADASSIAFFPMNDCAELKDVIPSTQAKGDTLALSPADQDAPGRLRGVFSITPKDTGTVKYIQVDLALGKNGHLVGHAPAAPATPPSDPLPTR